MKEPEVFETASGLAVVVDDAESLRAALRRERRLAKRERAMRRSQRLTGGSRGKAVWMPKAKRLNRIANGLKRTHPDVDARLTAKVTVQIEKDVRGLAFRGGRFTIS